MPHNQAKTPGVALAVTVGTAAALGSLGADAQPGSSASRHGGVERLCNAASTQTVSGTIVRIERPTSWPPGQQGVHVVLKTGDETLPVHLSGRDGVNADD